jgi:hypothetical protein
MKASMWQLKDFIGEKFFVRDNHDTPIKIGELVGYQKHHSGSALPIMKIDGKEYLSFSSIFPWSKEIESIFEGMSPQEQWDFIVKIKHFNSANDRMCSKGDLEW